MSAEHRPRPPQPLTSEELPGPRVELDLEWTDDTDGATIQQKVAAYEQQHGTTTHVMLWCAPHIITTTGQPTTLVIPRRQLVLLANFAEDIVHVERMGTWKRSTAAELGYLKTCYVPLNLATKREEDSNYLVRMKKIGVTRHVPLTSEQTFVVGTDGNGAYITCRVCNSTSRNRNDVREKYCGRCHRFHEAS